MARQVNFYAAKFSNVVILVFTMLFVVNFCTTIQEENKMLEKHLNSEGSVDVIADGNLQDKQCTHFLFLNISFAVVLAMLWNAKQAMKIGTI